MQISELQTPTNVNEFRELLLTFFFSNNQGKICVLSNQGKMDFINVNDFHSLNDFLRRDLMLTPMISIDLDNFGWLNENQIERIEICDEHTFVPKWYSIIHGSLRNILLRIFGEDYL